MEGFIPHDRQGGNGVLILAVVASKFAGSGLEKEQMEQIHVALFGPELDVKDDEACGLFERGEGDATDSRMGIWLLG